MTGNRTPAHQSDLFNALIGSAHGYDLDDRDLNDLTVPEGESAASFRSEARRVAEQAREAATQGAFGEARRLVREHCQQYDALEQSGINHTETHGKTPAELAALIDR